MVEGRYGDLNNAPEERKAGTIVGAAFLSNFVGDTPWAHLDIAGSASGSRPRVRAEERLGLWRATAGRAGALLRRVLSAFDGLRSLPRPRADPSHGARIRRGRGRAGRRGARPHEVLSIRDRREARQAEPDGNSLPAGVRRRGRGHAGVCAGGRGAHARGLVGGDHALRAHLAGHAADLPVRTRRPRGASGCRGCAPASVSAPSD